MQRLAHFGGAYLLLTAVFSVPGLAQTTQGLIVGRILDSVTGLPVSSALVSCTREGTNLILPAQVSAGGDFAIPSLSPGRYIVTANAPQYQSQQARALDIPVAGRVELNFRLRPLYDVWEAGQYRSVLLPQSQQAVGFYGPDVDTSRVAVFNANRGLATPLENARSDVISAGDIQDLPLVGRDVYTLLLLLPGVTSDTATARGLGFSVNGQRPSSSNYLLDGVENNNLVVTGPLTAAVPEFIQEYRISTTNYSAEYGRTSGFIANAVTRSGTNSWHGLGYFYLETDRLNANGFQENANGFARAPFTQIQPGIQISGPLIRNRLFLFGGFQAARSHGRGDPQLFELPTAAFINSTDPASYAGQLLRKYRPEVTPSGPGNSALAAIAPVTALNRLDGLLRLDYTLSAANQLFARLALDDLSDPELIPSPYRDFSTPFIQRSVSVAAGLISRLGASSQNEFRAARTGDAMRLDPPHADVPTLVDDEQVQSGGQTYHVGLPGNPSQANYRNSGRNVELLDNWTYIRSKHAFKFGGGFLQRNIDLRTSVYPQGYLEFYNLNDFALSQPNYLMAEYDQSSPTYAPVAPDRSYRYRQFDAFAQDSFHASARLTLDYGVRYELLGSPVNTGAQKDLLLQLGSGPSIENSIAGITQVLPPGGADETVYTARHSDWAVRTGLGWDPFGTGKTVIRAAYGIFYDPLFDNLWETAIQNRYRTGEWAFNGSVPLPLPLSQIEAAGTLQSSSELIASLAFQPYLRTPRTQSAYLGVQQQLSAGVLLEVNALASRARQLITTDEVNRPFSVPPTNENTFGYLYPADPNYINYRANQGSSDYAALVATVRFRKKNFDGQASYTWSHSIDNQSEPLAGAFFDFNAFGVAQKGAYPYLSSFTRQFASSLDRGNSDFDQRQNLVFYGTYRAPAIRKSRFAPLLHDWTISGLGAIRSGLPYTVYGPGDYTVYPPEYLINQRADLVSPATAQTSQPVAGGRLLLSASAFANAGPSVVGNIGRNAFTGPGLFNLDASIARSFHLSAARESLRLTTRADFYNVLNHANLNNPASDFGSPDFGIAQYGRQEINNGFPLLVPLNESAREVQILLRLEF